MPARTTERRLAAIMFTDIVGYTALMAQSEEKGFDMHWHGWSQQLWDLECAR